MTDELKPVRCGCGGEATVDCVIQHDGLYMAGVFCANCGTKTLPFWSKEKDKAIDYAVTTWNRAMSGSAEEKLKAFWDGMSAEMKEERTAKVESYTITINPPNNIWKCGNCGQQMCETHFGNRIKYCSNCGARLEWK